ncbi:MAG: Uma2 family endonuclease [Deltaproteobacteria bacterium]|jgi:Uma2 family endonuclease
MVEPGQRRATYQDVLDAPPNQIAQVVDGELWLQPRPNVGHANAATELTTQIRAAFGRRHHGHGGWHILFEPELHLSGNILVPDVAGWRRESVAELDRVAAYFDTRPDWVCEILSPSTQVLDRSRKMDLYAAEGVGHLWFVDPAAKMLEAYQRSADGWLRLGTWSEDATPHVAPFDALDLELALLWED